MVFAQYHLVNDGGEAVRIIKLESGCGCATPRVEPTTVEPGGTATVYAQARRPPFGEKTVDFTVYTDSPGSPQLRLQLRLDSSRRPPYLSNVRGELTFHGAIGVGDRAGFAAHTISMDEIGREPIIRSCPDEFACTLVDVEHNALQGADKWEHVYTYDVRFKKPPSPGVRVGELILEDPWDPHHHESLPININNTDGIQAFPRLLTLNLADPSSKAKFIIKSNTDHSRLIVEPDEASTFLSLERSQPYPGSNVSTVTVKSREGSTPADGAYRLRVKAVEEGYEEEISVVVKGGGSS